jgi:hypothetical protein
VKLQYQGQTLGCNGCLRDGFAEPINDITVRAVADEPVKATDTQGKEAANSAKGHFIKECHEGIQRVSELS